MSVTRAFDAPPATPGGVVAIPVARVRPPRGHDHDVVRSKLLSRLTAAGGDIVAVFAPAGFGKSTCVRQWAERSGRPVAWVCLDRADRDPVVLISAILAALEPISPLSWGESLLTGDEPAFTRRVLPRLAGLLDALPAPVTLVVDDVHQLRGAPAQRVLEIVADCLPAGSRLALVGRSAAPGVPWARWRGAGRLVEVTAADLALDADEVTDLLAAMAPGPPTAADVGRLLDRTHGWPVAVYLTARSGSAPLPPLDEVEPAVVEYLDTEILPGVHPGVLSFLRRTAILDTLSAPLCEAVLGDAGSYELLHRAERETRLLSRLEGPGAWFRLHPLVRERLERLEAAGDTAARHARAAGWYAAASYQDDAVYHAIHSQDPQVIGDIVWQAAVTSLLMGQCQRVTGWLDRIPEPVRQRSVPLAMLTTWAALNSGAGATAVRWAQITAAVMPSDWRDRLGEHPMYSAYAVWQAVSLAVPPGEGAALSGAGYAALPAGHPLRGLARLVQGWCQLLSGDPAGERLVEEAVVLAAAAEVGTTAVEGLALSAVVRLVDADPAEAFRLADRGDAEWQRRGLGQSRSTTVLLDAILGYRKVVAGDLGAARTHLQRAHQLAEAITPVFGWVGVLADALAARAAAASGDVTAACEALTGARRARQRIAASPLLNRLIGQAAEELAALTPVADLTPAERRVWLLLQTRMTQREIAGHLVVSPETIKSQAAAVYRKLGVASRREAQELGERLNATAAACEG